MFTLSRCYVPNFQLYISEDADWRAADNCGNFWLPYLLTYFSYLITYLLIHIIINIIIINHN
jgi:hypothetical protein